MRVVEHRCGSGKCISTFERIWEITPRRRCVLDRLLVVQLHLTLSLHAVVRLLAILRDRKSTRLNSSHSGESRMPSSA